MFLKPYILCSIYTQKSGRENFSSFCAQLLSAVSVWRFFLTLAGS